MASTTLTRTPSSAGNQKTWTLSAWVKNSYGGMFFCVDSHGATKSIQCDLYQGADYLEIAQYASGSGAWSLKTNRLFRDRNAWYHIVLSVDTTQATSSDRVKIYINGVRETSFSVETYPSQNYDTGANSAVTHMIGNRPGSSIYFDGLMTHFHFIDGIAYDASTFGETDATTGIWKPKTAPSVTYGTNGFFLKFENSGSMGTDSSGNANNLTVNGTLTQTVDTPSNVFATLNALDGNYNNSGVPSLSNGNLVNTDSAGYKPAFGTLAVSKGKWYYEYRFAGTPDSWVFGGWGNSLLGGSSLSVYRNSDGQLFDGSGYNAYGASYSAGDIIGVAFDYDNDQITFYKNGVSQGTATSLGINTDLSFPMVGVVYAGASIDVNFGNGYFGTTPVASAGSNGNGAIFEYDVPTGYYALNTKNINIYG